MNAVTSRFLAFALALIIGSPACWCCVKSREPVKKAKHSCCEQTREETPAHAPAPKDPCPCGASMIRREMAKTIIDLPPPLHSGLELAPVGELVPEITQPFSRPVPYFNDTGPPHTGLPIYLRQHALLM
jgi:hypothetical protein